MLHPSPDRIPGRSGGRAGRESSYVTGETGPQENHRTGLLRGCDPPDPKGENAQRRVWTNRVGAPSGGESGDPRRSAGILGEGCSISHKAKNNPEVRADGATHPGHLLPARRHASCIIQVKYSVPRFSEVVIRFLIYCMSSPLERECWKSCLAHS